MRILVAVIALGLLAGCATFKGKTVFPTTSAIAISVSIA